LLVRLRNRSSSEKLQPDNNAMTDFDGEQAYLDVLTQLNFGPRHPGSAGHARLLGWLASELSGSGWSVEIQNGVIAGQAVANILAALPQDSAEGWILIGAHLDTRQIADQDPDPAKRDEPVPGANDGASGVAVLLELSRRLVSLPGQPVKLVFFDAEDNGNIDGRDWALGARYFADQLAQTDGGAWPDAVLIIDMVGDIDLNVHPEINSNPALISEIWKLAELLGFAEQFPQVARHAMLDDHTPFIALGIPTALLIDFDYPYWHTTSDTADKVSAQSLDAVGEVILHWLRP